MSAKLQDMIAVVTTAICWHVLSCSKRQYNDGNATYMYIRPRVQKMTVPEIRMCSRAALICSFQLLHAT